MHHSERRTKYGQKVLRMKVRDVEAREFPLQSDFTAWYLIHRDKGRRHSCPSKPTCNLSAADWNASSEDKSVFSLLRLLSFFRRVTKPQDPTARATAEQHNQTPAVWQPTLCNFANDPNRLVETDENKELEEELVDDSHIKVWEGHNLKCNH